MQTKHGEQVHKLRILTFAIGPLTTVTSGCKRHLVAAYPKHLKPTFQKYYCFQESYVMTWLSFDIIYNSSLKIGGQIQNSQKSIIKLVQI